MKQRIFSHFQDYLIQYISHQYQDLLYCNSSQYILSNVFLCLLNTLVHRTHPLSSPKNLVKILVPIYRMQGDSVKHPRQKSSFKRKNTATTDQVHVFVNPCIFD